MDETSTPSMYIRPAAASNILKSASVKDDFPAPVLPQTPTRSPPLILNETSFKHRSSSGRYRMEKRLNQDVSDCVYIQHGR
jgi:hypothetical protein